MQLDLATPYTTSVRCDNNTICTILENHAGLTWRYGPNFAPLKAMGPLHVRNHFLFEKMLTVRKPLGMTTMFTMDFGGKMTGGNFTFSSLLIKTVSLWTGIHPKYAFRPSTNLTLWIPFIYVFMKTYCK